MWGEELYFDSTKVQANANINGMIERARDEVRQQMEHLFWGSNKHLPAFGKLVEKYNGRRLPGIRKPTYQSPHGDLAGQDGDFIRGKGNGAVKGTGSVSYCF